MILETLVAGFILIIPASLWFADRVHKREHDARLKSDPNLIERAVLQEARRVAKVELDKTPNSYSLDRVTFGDRLKAADKALIEFEQRIAKQAETKVTRAMELEEALSVVHGHKGKR